MNTTRLTAQEIAAGRDAAKQEYDAAMAFYDAAERWNAIQSRVATNFVSPTPAQPSFLTAASYEAASIKHGILLTLWEAEGKALSAMGIANRLREMGLVRADWPTPNVYPKLSGYGKDGLIEQADGGWAITPKGRDFVRTNLKAKGTER